MTEQTIAGMVKTGSLRPTVVAQSLAAAAILAQYGRRLGLLRVQPVRHRRA